ncbi:DUF4865 family protein [Streptomyces roseirectus]|uniref:DUF4865 family protein n=1 Tax=Streptomyces roseirectus TaxID=2768066 RepID=A0A7H0I7X2_9ACTN|nr:DUF4865 family protein [Streptomyces roseirectus]QNP68888.1 DUF4865 family protein [Streptomyces roseirectus]
MHAMQYELTFPADYDMRVIHARVARVGHLLDDWDGLGLKAYLLRERGTDGSPVNQYAPFYLWDTTRGMNRFLWCGPFQGLSDDFGRPAVRQWSGVAYEVGGAVGSPAAVAVRQRVPVPPDGVVYADVMEGEAEAVGKLAQRDGVIAAAAGVDTARWEILRFSVWAHDAPGVEGEVFRVLHLSTPGLTRLPRGRQW